MYTGKNILIIHMYKVLDISLTITSFVGAYFIKKFFLPHPLVGLSASPNYYTVLLMIIIIWFISLNIFHVYLPFNKIRLNQILFNIFLAVSTSIIFLVTCLFVFKIKDISRILIGIFYLNNLFMLFTSKILIFYLWRKYGQNGYNTLNILIIGSKQRTQNIIELLQSSNLHLNIIGCLEIDRSSIGKYVKDDIKIIGSIEDLGSIILNNVVDEIIFAMPLKDIESADLYIWLIEMIGINIRIFPDWHIHSLSYKPSFASFLFDNFNGFQTLILTTTSSKHNELMMKSTLDYILAGISTILLLPFLLVIACTIKLFSKGPVFFKQERIGLNGRKFLLYKFRTMVKDAENKLQELYDQNESDGPAFKIKNDPRIIPIIGTILRKTNLDELPQLINVLKGEMSLVGPRPPIQCEVEKYNVWQRRRLSMKPGLTCLWQTTHNRNDLSFNQWVEMDLKYIDNWSLKLDFQILLRTIKVVIKANGR